MEIAVIGLNHKTAPVEIREKLSFSKKNAESIFDELRKQFIFEERLILSTCNRTEIYGVDKDLETSIRKTKHFLSRYADLELERFESALYVLKQPDSVRHLFSVTSGLDSLVIGETEILGQVKDAYKIAHENQQTGKFLNTLFQRSLKVAKNLRTETQIGGGHVSIGTVAAELAEKIFETLKNAKIFVLGTGEMATQVAKVMVSKGAVPRIISSHHYERAKELAHELKGEALAFTDYERQINEADILVAATASSKALIREERVKRWMKIRHEKPLFMIDLAVPRNIDQACGKLDNVYLYNIDDLQQIADENRALREGQLKECWDRIGYYTRHYMDWLEKEFERKNDF